MGEREKEKKTEKKRILLPYRIIEGIFVEIELFFIELFKYRSSKQHDMDFLDKTPRVNTFTTDLSRLPMSVSYLLCLSSAEFSTFSLI